VRARQFLGAHCKGQVGDAGQCGAFLVCGSKGVVYGACGCVFWGGFRCLGECECGSGAEAGGAGGFGDGLGLFSNHVAMHHTAIPEPCDSSPSMRVIKLLMDAVYYCLPAQPIHHHLLPKP